MKKSKCKPMLSGIIFSILFSMIMGDYAFAHKVTVFAWVEGNTVYTESKFSGGKKAQNAPIEVFDAQGNKLLEGKTDENGEFSFKAPKKTEMKIVLLAGMGHRGEWTIHADEFEDTLAATSPTPPLNEPAATNSDKIDQSQSKTEKTSSSSPCLTSGEIQDVVEKALDKKLKHILFKLDKSLDPHHGPTVSEIFGGIGYILGLMGVGAYVNYRKKKE